MGYMKDTYTAATPGDDASRNCSGNCFGTPHAWASWIFFVNWILLVALTFGGTPALREGPGSAGAIMSGPYGGAYLDHSQYTDSYNDGNDGAPPWKLGTLTFITVNGTEMGTAPGKVFHFGVWGWCVTETTQSHPSTGKDGPGLLGHNVEYGRRPVVLEYVYQQP